MKLQKRLSRKYKDKKYHKYILVIPEKEIKKSGFKEGDDLKIETRKGEIKIKR
jgi:formylmethanofuran dehydrogenase subunit D